MQLARLGDGRVSPNPMVGAVVVAQGRIIGEGFHRKFGECHAEVNAINSVKPSDEHLLGESTIYVTLEPCSHYGKTPPCSKLIIDKQIPRIVVGCKDPFVEVSGRGIRMLREAGREVAVGILEEECKAINKKFITAHTLKRPYILLKWAESADRFIDRDRKPDEKPTVLSNPVTIAAVHKLRSEYDAIMVGTNTVLLDNPSLTVRSYDGRNPIRVTLDNNGRLQNGNLTMLSDGNPTIVFSDGESLPEICSALYGKGITSLMVEGGAKLLGSFIDCRLWDEIRIERSNRILTSGVEAPPIPDGICSESELAGSRILHIKRR